MLPGSYNMFFSGGTQEFDREDVRCNQADFKKIQVIALLEEVL